MKSQVDILETLEVFLKNYGVNHKNILVAFSGGVDSTVLLHALSMVSEKFALKINALHINHGLRGKESDFDSSFCGKLCKKLDINFVMINADIKKIAKSDKISIELAARNERKNILKNKANELNIKYIFLAHTKDDQIETILFRLARGTGVHGITGIKECINENKIQFLRPFLKLEKSELITFAKENNLSWVEDSSNAELDYTRNQIRHKLVPVFNEIFPTSFPDSLIRFSCLCESFLKEFHCFAKEKFKDSWFVFNKCIIIDITNLNSNQYTSFSEKLRIALIESELYFYLPSFSLAKKIFELCFSETGKRFKVYDRIWAYNDRGFLVIKHDDYLLNIQPNIYCNMIGSTSLPFKEGSFDFYKMILSKQTLKFSYAFNKELDLNKISWRLISTYDLKNVIINNKLLKNLLSEKKVPHILISQIVIVFYDNEPVLIPFIQGKKDFICDKGNEITFEYNNL